MAPALPLWAAGILIGTRTVTTIDMTLTRPKAIITVAIIITGQSADTLNVLVVIMEEKKISGFSILDQSNLWHPYMCLLSGKTRSNKR